MLWCNAFRNHVRTGDRWTEDGTAIQWSVHGHEVGPILKAHLNKTPDAFAEVLRKVAFTIVRVLLMFVFV